MARGHRFADGREPARDAEGRSLPSEGKGGEGLVPLSARFGTRAGELPKTPWVDIPRWQKRVFVQCNHLSSAEDAPRVEIGGVTRDLAVNLEGEEMFLSLLREDIDMRCPTCRRIWRVPVAALDAVARNRGAKPVRRLVHELSGVSFARTTVTG